MRPARWLKTALAAVALACLASPCAWAAPEVLAPAEGYRAVRGGAWVVVRGGGKPQVFVDGRKVDREPFEDHKIYHLRVYDFKPGGSTIEVRQPGNGSASRKVFGGHPAQGDPESPNFHRDVFPQCAGCHAKTLGNCTGCHRLPDHRHNGELSKKCLACHHAAGGFAQDVSGECVACHKQYGRGQHPRLKHVISGDADPLRTGHKLDCASCHDAHSPRRLGGLSKQELRNWCKRCHAK